MINIAICDDENTFIENNKMILDKALNELHVTAQITTYQNSANLLADITDDNKQFDLILLDIEMPKHNGMDIARKIKPFLPNSKIIFITSHMEFVLDAFELTIFRYVPKHDTENRLYKAICDALKIAVIENDKFYQISIGKSVKKILLKEIYYIKRDGKNAVFILDNTEEKIRKPLKNIFEEISLPEFIFIDRGVIANLIHIMKIYNGYACFRNGEKIAISRSHINEVKSHLNKYWGERI